MSPTLFNYAIDFVLERALRSAHGVLLGENVNLANAVGLPINAVKTKKLLAQVSQSP